MKNYVPVNKMSKKAQKVIRDEQRVMWDKSQRPQTVPAKKGKGATYKRNKRIEREV
jgi:hypothetical protein